MIRVAYAAGRAFGFARLPLTFVAVVCAAWYAAQLVGAY